MTVGFGFAVIELKNIRKSFDEGKTWVVDDLSLTIESGELMVLLGESGCGKTTTLKMINRLVEPTEGQVLVDGTDISTTDPVSLRRSIGYVFQRIGLFPHLSIAQNVGIVPKLKQWDEGESNKAINHLLELVELDPAQYRDRFPSELSGGQQQRVAFARALAGKPNIVLMDEPFGALDPLTRDTLQTEFLQLHKKLNLSTVLVTHDMAEALLLADRIAVIQSGTILQIGTPKEFLKNPKTEYIANLIRTPKSHADRIHQLSIGEA